MAEDHDCLIVTNGDCAAAHLRRFGFEDPILPWRDVLHDGPVPDLPLPELSEIRALFIFSRGWDPWHPTRLGFAQRDWTFLSCARFREVILWFEHDLYDQLQLLQTVSLLAEMETRPRLSSVLCKPHITAFADPQLSELFGTRQPIAPEQLQLGARLWKAFTQGEYRILEAVAKQEDSTFPHLAEGLYRWLQEFPSLENGLNRSEKQIVQELQESPGCDPVLLFQRTQAREADPFLGDSSFWSYLQDLNQRGIVHLDNGAEFAARWELEEPEDFRKQSLILAPEVEESLEMGGPLSFGPGSEPGYSRWMGGRLISRHNPWRWDDRTGLSSE